MVWDALQRQNVKAQTSAAPSGAAGGDLSGTYPDPTVAKINGVPLGTTTATTGHLLIADGTDWESKAMSGDASIVSSGALTLGNSGVSAGSYTNADITVDAKGRVTVAANGSSGSSAPAPHRALIVGGLYTDTMVTGNRNSQWGGNDATYLTGGKMGIVYVGEPAEWDQMRQRVAAFGDTFGTYVWGIYELDDATLLPTALVFDSGWQTYAATGDRVVTPGSPVATTTNFVGLGICCVGTNPGGGRPTFVAQYVSEDVGFYYYGASAIPTSSTTTATWSALRMTSATQPRANMAAANAWTVSGNMSGATDEDVDGGLWARRSA